MHRMSGLHFTSTFGRPERPLILPCARAGLASFQDASRFGSRFRWSFRLRPGNDHRLPAANPAGLGWSPKRNWKTSRTPAPARTNPSLMQP
jgi:hypothetical protein